MGFDEWRIVLDKIVSHTRYVNVTGGEATLHPHFAEIVSYLGRLDIPFVLLTNGRWQDPESLTAMLSSIPQCYGILVSLHGSTADVHEVFTGVVGSFDETIANIQRTVRAGMPVETSTVITHQNCRQLEQIAELARRLGARRAKFNRYLAWEAQHGLLDHMLPSDSELITAVKTIEHLRRTTLDEFDTYYGPCIPQCFTPSSSHGCSAGETFCAIDPWGNVTPCTHTSLTCGNLLEMDIEQIWNGEVMEAWRNLMPEGCSGCSLLSQCGTGCRAMAVESGLGYDPLMRRPIRADSTLPLYASIPRFDIPTNLASKTTISHT
jgi:radical SAM protein with 4Fe4S-binding SPASM domain